IAHSAALQHSYTVLAQAASVVASPQIRNMGTLGGNICQDVWCWYLQDGFSCWKSGGKFCDLAGGDSRYYGSIMGGHLCLSNHPSDTAVAIASVAVSAVIEGGMWDDVRIVLGGIATSPYRSREAEDLLRNQPMSEGLATAAADAALQQAKPLKMNGYKVDLSRTLVRRALMALVE